ncbi:MAG: hypothetical protein EOP49_33985, partial [Sphingobacteriales bacterium]
PDPGVDEFALTPCSGMPLPGTATGPTTAACQPVTATLSLAGFSTEVGVSIQWEYFDGTNWNAIPNATNPTHTATGLTETTPFRAMVTCINSGLFDNSNTVTVNVTSPQILQTFPGARCNPGPVTLVATADAGNTISWYAAATGGTALSTGGAFTTPSLTNTTTYYVSARAGGAPENLASPTATTSTFFSAATGWGLRFTVNNTATINTVTVHASNATAGPATMQIKVTDLADVVLYTGTLHNFNVTTTLAPYVIPVNISVPPGNYKMVMTSTGINNLVRESGGVTFPYTGPSGAISITAGANGVGTAQTTAAYYWFYNWNISTGCEGPRVAVDATIQPTVTGTGLAHGGTVVANNQADGSTLTYEDACVEKVATVADAANGTGLGITSAIVVTPPTVQTFNNRPYVPRIYDITPANNTAATVTIYALQSEFDAYNTYVTANSLSLPLLPNSPTDLAAVPNIVVTQYHGGALAGTTGPAGLYNAAQEEYIPNSSISATWSGQY